MRLSIGLEDIDDLIDDLDAALDAPGDRVRREAALLCSAISGRGMALGDGRQRACRKDSASATGSSSPRASRASTRGHRRANSPPTSCGCCCCWRHGTARPSTGANCAQRARGRTSPAAEERLRAAVAALRASLGETPRQPRYIAAVGSDALALIAHFEPFATVRPGSRAASRAAPASRRPPAARLHALLGELRRRNVLKVTASYLVGMWIVLQVAQITFEPLRFPDWWMTALTILAIIGLPIVVVLAWTYEITPQGVVRRRRAAGPGVRPRLPRARQSIAPVIVAGVALMAAVTGLAWWRSLDDSARRGREPSHRRWSRARARSRCCRWST